MTEQVARVVLVHGAVSEPEAWGRVPELLRAAGVQVEIPERPRTGDLAAELAWLRGVARDAWIVGLSGGATLALGLAATDPTVRGVIAHEPAVGSLVPGLLAPMAAAFAEGGVEAFGRVLYGPSWTRPAGAGGDDALAARELAMFRTFEPGPPVIERALVTVGADSPVPRHRAAEALRELGYQVREVPRARHYVGVDRPEEFAAVVLAYLA